MLTDFLKLFKADPADGDKTFNITTMLNENWDKVNDWAKGVNVMTSLNTTFGTAPNYLVTIPELKLVAGTRVTIKFHVASSAISTLKINSEAAYGIKKPDGFDFKNIKSGIYTLVFDGLNFMLQGEGASGNAEASDLLSGKTASTDAGEVTGTMPNRGSIGTQTLTSEGAEYTIPQGYHNGLGKVKATISGLVASVIKAGVAVGGIVGTFTSDANAVAGQILNGATAYVNGVKITGTLVTNYLVQGAYRVSGNTIYVKPPKAHYDGVSSEVYISDSDFVPSNIKAGVDLFGLVGTLVDGSSMKKYASGTAVSSAGTNVYQTNGYTINAGLITVTGLAFTPELIILKMTNSTYEWLTVYDPISGLYSKTYKMIQYNSGSIAVSNVKADTGPCSVSSGGFVAPVMQPGGFTFEWRAYGS